MVEGSKNKVNEYVKSLSLGFTFPDTRSPKPWSDLYDENFSRIAAACPNVKSFKFYMESLLIEELGKGNWKHLEYIHRLFNAEDYDFYLQYYLKAASLCPNLKFLELSMLHPTQERESQFNNFVVHKMHNLKHLKQMYRKLPNVIDDE